VTYYVVDDRNPSGYAQVLEEITAYAGTTNLTKVYAYGLDLISQEQPGAATNYYGHDGHGSVRYLTDTNGGITDTYTYDAYGNLIATSGSTANNYLYCGEQYDPQLKLYYNRARYLNPDTGRFLTMDTFAGNNEDPLSLHKYLYCKGNPVNGGDPSGKFDVDFDFGSFLDSFSLGNIVPLAVRLADDATEEQVELTGAEPVYNPSLWNSSAYINVNNCYAYAVNNPVSSPTRTRLPNLVLKVGNRLPRHRIAQSKTSERLLLLMA
jgi:RHS repeat-associated protein